MAYSRFQISSTFVPNNSRTYDVIDESLNGFKEILANLIKSVKYDFISRLNRLPTEIIIPEIIQ